jgi:hypothetical protein
MRKQTDGHTRSRLPTTAGLSQRQITLTELVDWAENCFVTGGFAPDEDISMLVDIVMYLSAADTTAFPLTWDVLTDFLTQLGSPVRVVPLGAA